MSLETVVEDIRDEARTRAEEIREEARTEADRIVKEAREDAEKIRTQREREVERQIEQEGEQKLSSATLEAKQERLEARRRLLQEVRDEVEATIASLEEGREELTRALLDAAAEEFGPDDQVAVYGRADDAELLESILDDYEDFEYAGEYDCLGGVVVESETSRVRVKNTFDSVLDEVWEDNLREISDRLFEDQ